MSCIHRWRGASSAALGARFSARRAHCLSRFHRAGEPGDRPVTGRAPTRKIARSTQPPRWVCGTQLTHHRKINLSSAIQWGRHDICGLMVFCVASVLPCQACRWAKVAASLGLRFVSVIPIIIRENGGPRNSRLWKRVFDADKVSPRSTLAFIQPKPAFVIGDWRMQRLAAMLFADSNNPRRRCRWVT